MHVLTTLPVAAMAEYDRPVGIGGLVLVDTTAPVDVPAVAARVRACLAGADTSGLGNQQQLAGGAAGRQVLLRAARVGERVLAADPTSSSPLASHSNSSPARQSSSARSAT